MAHLSAYIGQAALQNFFPHLSNKQSETYNPQYNGWDSPQDMPQYNKLNTKPGAYAEASKTGEKLNAQLIDHIFFKPNKQSNQN